jgi:hypothetical protein
MFIQAAPEGQPNFVIKQLDHALVSSQLATAFGGHFAPLSPADAMLFVVKHHDQGWKFLDDAPPFDPKTGLPYHLTQTPLPMLLQTGKASPDFNEKHHPYSGLISSMHITGLYNGRYGMSNFVFIDNIPAGMAEIAQATLDYEAERQAFLRSVCGERPDSAHHVSDVQVMHNYKLLQFFDTLAIYFHSKHPSMLAEQTFANVPRNVGDDVTVTVTPLGESRFSVSPWPFADETVEVTCTGRYLMPTTSEAEMQAAYVAATEDTQRYTLVPA